MEYFILNLNKNKNLPKITIKRFFIKAIAQNGEDNIMIRR